MKIISALALAAVLSIATISGGCSLSVARAPLPPVDQIIPPTPQRPALRVGQNAKLAVAERESHITKLEGVIATGRSNLQEVIRSNAE